MNRRSFLAALLGGGVAAVVGEAALAETLDETQAEFTRLRRPPHHHHHHGSRPGINPHRIPEPDHPVAVKTIARKRFKANHPRVHRPGRSQWGVGRGVNPVSNSARAR